MGGAEDLEDDQGDLLGARLHQREPIFSRWPRISPEAISKPALVDIPIGGLGRYGGNDHRDLPMVLG